MSKFSRLKVLTTLLETGMVPLFYHDEPETAARVIQACLDGGARCVEFTNRGDGAHLVFTELVRHFREDPDLILGAGTVLDAPTAALFLQLGANFIVGPTFNPEVARLCNRRMVPYIPGCATTTEIAAAHELGVEICKVFPGGELGGPDFIRSMHGPLPWARLMPTGGVAPEKENILAWMRAGAAAVGLGSRLISARTFAAGDFAPLTASVRDVLAWVREARQGASVL